MSTLANDAVTEAPAAPHPWFASAASALVAATLVALGTYHLLLTASTVFAYTLRYPFMDQFRFNVRYLTVPFPESVVALENGHRPIIPGIVRIIELRWLDGVSTLQAISGWLGYGIAVAIVLREVRRGVPGNALLQAIAFCTVATLIGWNANARIFIHPFEVAHIFYPFFFAVAAVALVARVQARSSYPVWLAAIALCVAGTFSFGVGIASFAALISVAILCRHGVRIVMLVSIAAIVTLLVYYIVLPGAAGVQGMVGVSPALAFFVCARLGAIFAELFRLFEPLRSTLALTAWLSGAVAIALTTSSVITRWRRHEPFSELQAVALGLFMFGFTANGLIAVSRTEYFFDYPGELFADRYLFWSCVAWCGLVIYGLTRLYSARPVLKYAAAGGVIVFSALAVQSATWANGWSAAVYRIVELVAVAERLSIRNDAHLDAISDGGPAVASRSFDEMREYKLAMFADGTRMRVGDKVHVGDPQARAATTVSNVAVSGNFGKPARLLSGTLTDEPATEMLSSPLWFVAGDGTLIGAAGMTSAVRTNRFLLGTPKWVGFEGYVPQSDATQIVLAAFVNGTVKPIARLELQP